MENEPKMAVADMYQAAYIVIVVALVMVFASWMSKHDRR
jgi:hypothetical protein